MFNLGKLLITCGVALVITGALVLLGDWLAWLWLGRLPDDIILSSKTGSVRLYIPLMTGLLLSLLPLFILWLLQR